MSSRRLSARYIALLRQTSLLHLIVSLSNCSTTEELHAHCRNSGNLL